MNINELTIGQAREIASLVGSVAHSPATPFAVGSAYLIRTVTMAWTGRVSGVIGNFLILEDAAWIADTGRYADATNESALNEVEPRDGPVIIGLGAIVDAADWAGDLPREQK